VESYSINQSVLLTKG